MADPVADDYNKSHVIHKGTSNDNNGSLVDTTHRDVNYVVDKDGNIREVYTPTDQSGTPSNKPPLKADKTTDLIDENGNVIKSGSDAAKNLYNNTDPNDPNKYGDPFTGGAPVTPQPDIVPFQPTGDQTIFGVPEKLTNAGVNWSTQAGFILTTVSDLNNFSDLLHTHLTTNAKISFDGFWTEYSKALLDTAAQAEKVGVLLSNAAVAYLDSDDKILKAFHGDPTVEKKIEGDINTIKNNQQDFKDNFNKAVDKEKQIDDTTKQDKSVHDKEQVIHHTGRGPTTYPVKVDKDGHITSAYSGQPVTDGVIVNGHVVANGSQAAKDLYNKGLSDPGSTQGKESDSTPPPPKHR